MTDALFEAVAKAIGAARIQIRGEGPTVLAIDTVYARAALAAIEASDGHVVVPWKPTPAMEAAGLDAAGHAHPDSAVVVIYCTMISARPKQEDQA